MSKRNGPEPFFRPKKNRWYVQLGGKQINLGPDEATARARWHQLMAGGASDPGKSGGNSGTPADGGPLVCQVFDRFLVWCDAHRPGRTAEWYAKHLESFLNSLPDRWTLTVADLKPFHVVTWADAHMVPAPGRRAWGPNHRRGAITAVQRALAWAEKMGHVGKSPLRGIDKPAPKRREQVLTPAEFADLLARVPDPNFRAVLEFCWETGCRVQEVRLIQAGHVRFDRGRVELPPALAKGKKRWRFVYLTPRAEAVLRGLMRAGRAGPLFRNAKGRPWEAQAFNCAFCRLQHRLGREELKRQGVTPDPEEVRAVAAALPPTKRVAGVEVPKSAADLMREARKKLTNRRAARLGTKFALTAVRHSFATRLLESGVDHLTVSALMGHADGTMLAKVYSHVGQKTDFLRDELLRASAATAATAGGAGGRPDPGSR